jgi:hypothetical protein
MWGPFPGVMGVLGRQGREIVALTPSWVLCHVGLWPEREFDELIWELPNLGLGAPFFLVGAYRGSGDRERLGSGLGPPNLSMRHALLGASVASPNPLGLAILG